jgi:hypothetical protein
MIEEAQGRREHLETHIAELEAGVEPKPHDHPRRKAGASRIPGSAR